MERYRAFLLRFDDFWKTTVSAVAFLLKKINYTHTVQKEIFMTNFRKQKSLIALTITLVVIVMLAIVNATGGEGFTFANSLWAILPPVIAIGLALITKEAYSSLFVGILIGSLMASNFSFSGTMDTIISEGLIASIEGTAGIFLFLVILGVIVALVNKTGASAAFGRWAETHIKTKVGATLATFLLGVLIFIDDYFNCLTVGAVMSPVTDAHKVSRVKLAYIIDATAAPICMIAPVSSWAAAVSSYVESETYSGIELFIRAIPFNFYSLMTLVFVVTITLLGFDYGKMSEFRIKAENGDNAALEATTAEDSPVDIKKVHVFGDIRLNCAEEQYQHERESKSEAQVKRIAKHLLRISACKGQHSHFLTPLTICTNALSKLSSPAISFILTGVSHKRSLPSRIIATWSESASASSM